MSESLTASIRKWEMEVARLRAERDYYRRRWLCSGIKWSYFHRREEAMRALAKARERDV